MGPMVNQLEKEYAPRVAFKAFVLDDVSPGTPAFEEMQQVGTLAHFRVTPTFVFVSAKGKVLSRYEGTTSYWTLKRDLEALLNP